jgi:biopolymer transport protein TolQ
MLTLTYCAIYVGGEVVNLILQSGPVAKAVLVILLLFSVFSWAVMLSKWSAMGRAHTQSGRFLRAFRKAARLEDVAAIAPQFRDSPLASVFDGGYTEYRRQGGNAGGVLPNMTAIERATQIAASEELSRLERRLPWLATTGTVTPFIGLFGTVWGIMDAFHGLGTAGAATLRAVAPGVSEALVTTAAGLAAAIPAVIAYNHFTHSVREFAARMGDFALEFLNAVERNTPEHRG